MITTSPDARLPIYNPYHEAIMKKKSILGKLALSPFYILKGIWEWSGQMEDEPQEDNNVTCKYCGLDFP